LRCIRDSPGIRYRELLVATGFPQGVMAYHLIILEASKRVIVRRYHKKTTRYYPLTISTKESRVIDFIRRPTAGNIITLLIKRNRCTFSELQRTVGKRYSTVLWHISRLLESGIISTSNRPSIRAKETYQLRSRSLVVKTMRKMKFDK
jgi:predicted transcriptional regulator